MILKSRNINTMLGRGLKKLPVLAVLSLSLSFGLTSCESVYDNRDECVHGIKLKFVYDYHMEPGANSFFRNVDCVTVYVFDNEGNYLEKYTETSDQLMNDNYRMILPLDEGDYRLMVYGGVSCEKNSFEINESSWTSRGSANDILVTLPLSSEGVSNTKLHDIEERTGGLFYGYSIDTNNPAAIGSPESMTVSVTNDDFDTDYTEHTVYMMKNTNNIQVILQELSAPTEVDYNDYEFEIVDDNFKHDVNNNAISVLEQYSRPKYTPYAAENRISGYVTPIYRDGAPVEPDYSHPVQVACAEFSTSRLYVDNLEKCKLVIRSVEKRNSDGSPKEIISLPLINYLALTRGFGSSWIKSDQEYLDRQSNWNLMFFLRDGVWISGVISVNDWTVRVNNIELGH